MSAGELFELVRPVISIVSAVVATWVLASARRRFAIYIAVVIAVGTFFFPLILFPLYLAVLLLWPRPRFASVRWRFAIPLAFLALTVGSIAIYKYIDDRRVDTHLSRAMMAKLASDPSGSIREYRRALEIEDSPHTHKLLAYALEDAGLFGEAIIEFRKAEQGGEPDDTIPFRVALLMDRRNQKKESVEEFKKFLGSSTCKEIDYRCEAARQRVEDSERTK
jgi:hypothetical protein